MSGQYDGLQARIRKKCVTALCNGNYNVYKEILDALKTIKIDDKTSPDV